MLYKKTDIYILSAENGLPYIVQLKYTDIVITLAEIISPYVNSR